MKTIITALITGASILTGLAQENMAWKAGPYIVEIETAGSFGSPDYKYTLRVKTDDTTLLEKKSKSSIQGLQLLTETIAKADNGLWLGYADRVDGLDDTYVHLLKFTGNRIAEATSTISFPEGVPTLKGQSIPPSMGEEGQTRLNRATKLAWPELAINQNQEKNAATTQQQKKATPPQEKTKEPKQESKPRAMEW